jgi:translocation and assembly module TamB
MGNRQQKKRRLVRGLLWLPVLGIFLVVLLPVWFPWVLTPVVKRFGLGFTDYDRMGWTRFALTGVHWEWNGTRLEIKRAESVLPTTWLWRKLNDSTNGSPLLSVSDAHLIMSGSTTNTKNPGSAEEALGQISRIGLALERFLPAATLTNGTVQLASNRVSFPHAQWRAGRLRAVAQAPSLRGEIELIGRISGDSALRITAGWKAYEASLRGEFSRTAEGWRWNGELGWLTNRAGLTAQFATNGWWPTQAQLNCQSWQIPAELLKLEGYEHLIATVTANLISNRFDLQATGFAHPSDAFAQRGFPEVKFSLGADGDPTGVNLRTLDLQSPWLNAGLTNTVRLTWTGAIQAEPAQLRVSADLGKLPGATLTGQVQGVVRIEPQGARPPVVQFRFSGAEVSAGKLDTKTISFRGDFAAPILKLDELRADFADGSAVVAGGAFDIERQRITEGRWQLFGGFLQTLLPGVGYAELVASGAVDGPLTHLTHRGEAAFTDCRVARLKPFDLRLKWSGQHKQLTAIDVEMTAGKSMLSVGAAADLDVTERGVTARLDHLSLRRENENVYTLRQPCAITLAAGATNVPAHRWRLYVDAFKWQSERHTLSANADLSWPSHGNATLSMTNIAFAEFSDFFEADIANILVAELAVATRWSNGPVHSVISAAGSVTNGAGRVFELRANLKTGEVFTIDQLTLASNYAPALSVTGSVPVKIILPQRAEDLLAWDKSQQIVLAVDWKEGRPESLLVPLGTWGRLEISQPDLRLRISGTPDKPSAELTAGVTKLSWQSKTTPSPLPKLENVQVAVEVYPDAIRLEKFTAKLDGQPVAATGEWPLSAEDWRDLWSDKKLPNWNKAQGRLELNEAQLAAFSIYLPKMLSPEGQLRAALELKTGKRLAGLLSLTNAATRSIGTITPMRDIAASVRFNRSGAELEDFRGQIGGQPVRAEGFVSVAKLDGTGLDYQVHLHGSNVPLARSLELLLRGDFDLSFRGASNLPPLVSGAVTLHNGLFVQDASALVWSGPRRPEWHPPYFSVTNEPFADWKLNLAVHGDDFLRARTPVFSGVLSADFQLRGSLRAPVLTGEARVNSGRLLFPFGSLALDQGTASFSGNDPRGPTLQINASGRNYRYDLRLEVKGPADGANVTFSSTPPLASDAILLMLTAGEIPQSDFAFSNSARAGRLGTFLGTDLLNRYLGTDPARERLTFRSGESISEEGRLTYSVEYRLTDRWSIIGEYDEFNDFNANLKWKIFAR